MNALVEQLDNILLDPACTEEVDWHQEAQSTTRDSILEYLGGYIVHKFEGGQCVPCVATLKSEEEENIQDLITIKTHGGLNRPSQQLMRLLKLAESHVRESTEGDVKFSIYSDIIESVLIDDNLPSAAVGCKLHYVEKTAGVLNFFLRCRLHFFTREKNKKFNEITRRSVPAGGGKKQQTKAF